jgi:hypothetical protein
MWRKEPILTTESSEFPVMQRREKVNPIRKRSNSDKNRASLAEYAFLIMILAIGLVGLIRISGASFQAFLTQFTFK